MSSQGERVDLARATAPFLVRAVDVIGDRWSIAILAQVFLRARTFNEMQRNLGISRSLLARRLKTLVAQDFVQQDVQEQTGNRVPYSLTPKGWSLHYLLIGLVHWADRYLAGEEGTPIVLRHKACGGDAAPALVCSTCGEPVRAGDLVPEPGPALAAGNGRVEHLTASSHRLLV